MSFFLSVSKALEVYNLFNKRRNSLNLDDTIQYSTDLIFPKNLYRKTDLRENNFNGQEGLENSKVNHPSVHQRLRFEVNLEICQKVRCKRKSLELVETYLLMYRILLNDELKTEIAECNDLK